MDFGNLQMALERITPRSGVDAWDLSILGMGIVYFGLIIISLCVYFLPLFINCFDRIFNAVKSTCTRNKKSGQIEYTQGDESELRKEQEEEETHIALAIAIALNLDAGAKTEKITWERYEGSDSSWKISGRVSQLQSHGTMRRL